MHSNSTHDSTPRISPDSSLYSRAEKHSAADPPSLDHTERFDNSTASTNNNLDDNGGGNHQFTSVKDNFLELESINSVPSSVCSSLGNDKVRKEKELDNATAIITIR